MSIDSNPLSLYQTFNYFQNQMWRKLPPEMIFIIKEHYIAQYPVYDECKTKINNDLFPTQVYRQLKLMKDRGLGDYKVGGSAALKLASADEECRIQAAVPAIPSTLPTATMILTP